MEPKWSSKALGSLFQNRNKYTKKKNFRLLTTLPEPSNNQTKTVFTPFLSLSNCQLKNKTFSSLFYLVLSTFPLLQPSFLSSLLSLAFNHLRANPLNLLLQGFIKPSWRGVSRDKPEGGSNYRSYKARGDVAGLEGQLAEAVNRCSHGVGLL